MSSIETLRKIIREEVTKVIRQELPKIISESTISKTDYKKNLQEQVKKASVPLTLNEDYRSKPIKFTGNNPLSNLLNETSISMTTDDIHGFSNGIHSQKDTIVGDVNSMLNNARKSTNIESVEIDTVPDFTGMMQSLKNKGLL
jgi:hypothetical protein